MEGQELVTEEFMPLRVDQVQDQVNRIQQIMRAVMIEDEHYGIIPGTKKKALWKAGAEKLMMTFRITSDPEVEDISTPDEVRYRVRVKMITQGGLYLGAGVGECSSLEEKYLWRKAKPKEEFDDTPEDRRRLKWASYDGKSYQIKQVRVNPSDVANTVLKMAKKRALIDATLTCLAASDIFSQVEDLPVEMQVEAAEEAKPPLKEPHRKSTNGKKSDDKITPNDPNALVTPAQVKMIETVIGKSKIVGRDDVKSTFDVEHFKDLTMGRMNDVLRYIQTGKLPGEDQQKPSYTTELETHQKRLGDKKFMAVLGGHGYESIEDIPSEELAQGILSDLRTLVKKK